MAAEAEGGALPKNRCVSCGSTESRISRYEGDKFVTRITDNREFSGHTICADCYYTGAGYAYIYNAVISHCRAMGVKLDVWQTGGGCQNFAVLLDPMVFEYGVTPSSVLFGLLGGDLADDELGICISDNDGDYLDELSDDMNERYPVPETRTVESVANWIVSVVQELRT